MTRSLKLEEESSKFVPNPNFPGGSSMIKKATTYKKTTFFGFSITLEPRVREWDALDFKILGSEQNFSKKKVFAWFENYCWVGRGYPSITI